MDDRKETFQDVMKKIRDSGFRLSVKKSLSYDEKCNYVYKLLKDSIDRYYLSLLGQSKMCLKEQYTIDFLISFALKEENEKSESYVRDAVKRILISEMENGNPILLGCIALQKREYVQLLLKDDVFKKTFLDYLTMVSERVQKLISKYEITGEQVVNPRSWGRKITFSQHDITPEEQLFLLKALQSGWFDQKYPKQIESIKRIILYKCEHEDPTLSNTEKEFIIMKIAQEKSESKKLIYSKPYLAELDEYENPLEVGGNCNNSGLIFINGDCSSSIIVPNLLHEYEHWKQITDARQNVLNKSALSFVFFDMFNYELSKDNYSEYNENYDDKLSELYANEAARVEYHMLLIKNHIHSNNERENMTTARGYEGQLYRDSVATGKQKDEQENRYLVNIYNAQMTEKILNNNPNLLKKYPILEHFYNVDEKRMKSLLELSSDYKEQNTEGRNAFEAFTEYQVLNGGLDNINFNDLKESDKLSLVLMVTRNATSLLSRISIAIEDTPFQNNKNYEPLIAILKSEISFLRQNKAQIDILRKEESGELALEDDERTIFDLQMCYEHYSTDWDIETRLQSGNRAGLKANSLNSQSNPFYLMQIYIKNDFKTLLEMSMGKKRNNCINKKLMEIENEP